MIQFEKIQNLQCAKVKKKRKLCVSKGGDNLIIIDKDIILRHPIIYCVQR